MKKVFVFAALMMFVAGWAFAGTDLADNTASAEGAAIYAGDSQANAAAATYPMVKLSTGVKGVVNFDTSTPVTYAIITKHTKGSKAFGTAHDSTTIFWKQSPANTALTGTIAGDGSDNTNFSAWTSY